MVVVSFVVVVVVVVVAVVAVAVVLLLLVVVVVVVVVVVAAVVAVVVVAVVVAVVAVVVALFVAVLVLDFVRSVSSQSSSQAASQLEANLRPSTSGPPGERSMLASDFVSDHPGGSGNIVASMSVSALMGRRARTVVPRARAARSCMLFELGGWALVGEPLDARVALGGLVGRE